MTYTAVRLAGLSAGQIRVYLLYWELAGRGETLTRAEIAGLLGLSEESVRKYGRHLSRAGLLQVGQDVPPWDVASQEVGRGIPVWDVASQGVGQDVPPDDQQRARAHARLGCLSDPDPTDPPPTHACAGARECGDVAGPDPSPSVQTPALERAGSGSPAATQTARPSVPVEASEPPPLADHGPASPEAPREELGPVLRAIEGWNEAARELGISSVGLAPGGHVVETVRRCLGAIGGLDVWVRGLAGLRQLPGPLRDKLRLRDVRGFCSAARSAPERGPYALRLAEGDFDGWKPAFLAAASPQATPTPRKDVSAKWRANFLAREWRNDPPDHVERLICDEFQPEDREMAREVFGRVREECRQAEADIAAAEASKPPAPPRPSPLVELAAYRKRWGVG